MTPSQKTAYIQGIVSGKFNGIKQQIYNLLKEKDLTLEQLCKHFDKTPYHERLLNYNRFDTNVWYTHEFFDFKVFKKGTMHIKFRDVKVWELLNRKYAEIKGFTLPQKF